MAMGNVLKNEPVLITGLVQAVIGLLLAFGVSLSDEQIGSIMAVTAMMLAILARAFVTPNNKVPDTPPPGPPPAEAPMYPDQPEG